jgi:hypothetical protein
MKKILITTMFLCSISALNAQTGPIHPKEPSFNQQTKLTMQRYFFEMAIEIEIPACIESYPIEEHFKELQDEYDFEFRIQQISYGKARTITYVFFTNDNRLFFRLGVFVGTLYNMCELQNVESN